MSHRSLMVIAAHPDDETLGFGGTIARYASEGVDVTLVTATRGDRGRWKGIAPGSAGHPGAQALAALRESELRDAASVLGVRGVDILDYPDGRLDQVDPQRNAAVAEWKRQRREVFVPLTYRPGDLAEVDFFEVLVDLDGTRRKAWLFLMRLMYSGRDFAWIYKRQDQVSFLDGHVRAFAHFGGVPARGVRQSQGGDRAHSRRGGAGAHGPLRGVGLALSLRAVLLSAR